MDKYKRKILVVGCSIIVVMLFVGTAAATMTVKKMISSHTVSSPEKSKQISTLAQTAPAASDVCIQVAPHTLKAYLANPRTHTEWFVDNANGLQIPPSEFLPQPLEQFTGSLINGHDRSMAVCSVWTGLESPWILQFTYSQKYGWRATSVSAPAEGAYNTESALK